MILILALAMTMYFSPMPYVDMKRNLLIFQYQPTGANLYEALTDFNWKIHVACNIDEAFNLLIRNKFLAGFFLIEEQCLDKLWPTLVRLCERTPETNWVIGLSKEALSARPSAAKSCRFIADYCFDYLVLPVDIERLGFSLGHAYGMGELAQNCRLDITDFPNYGNIIGASPVMRKLYKQIDRVSKAGLSVLIEGETGTGKELIADVIHAHSCRSTKPFIAINCGAFPPELIQGELFGWEKGAFTGAHSRRIGRIEMAHGGTLFLDEIGDLPLSQQVNLLRFLEERTIERIGGTEKISVDVQIISATHVDLLQAMRAGNFREDLYYRLRVLHLKVPPLRDRGADIELLAWFFFQRFSKEARRRPRGFTVEALYLLQQHNWPGNIRELLNRIRHAIIMSDNRLLTPADLGLEKRCKDRAIRTLEAARAAADREVIISAIQGMHHNLSRAAEALGISRVSLYRLMEKYKIRI